MPGFGNPLTDIDIGDFNNYLSRAGFVAKIAAGTLSDRDIVQQEASASRARTY